MKLSYGERDAFRLRSRPQCWDRGREVLRSWFLHYVGKRVPEVLDGLERGLALPFYRGRLWWPVNVRVREFLIEWSSEWYLNKQWVHERAFWTLSYWASCAREEYRIRDLGVGPLSSSASLTAEGLPPCYPEIESCSDYLARVRQDYGRGEMAPFVESMVRAAKFYYEDCAREMKPPAQRPHLKRDILWTVRYQLKGEKPKDIALKDEISQDQVEQAIFRRLNELDLEPRYKRGAQQSGKNYSHLGRH